MGSLQQAFAGKALVDNEGVSPTLGFVGGCS